MENQEKKVNYRSCNSYSTLNLITEKTQNCWWVFHGLGYLSRYFLKYFEDLNSKKNYFIAPQAPAKYYQDRDFKYIGASWLTRESTEQETENILNYLDAIYHKELANQRIALIILGYSQGVSIAARWVARRKINCQKLILHSGGFPKELGKEDFTFLDDSTSVHLIYGKQDPYLNQEKIDDEKKRVGHIFGPRLQILPLEGGHEIKKETLLSFDR